MASLLVVTGPPGAGKSTVARILADRSDPSVLVAGDAFFEFLAQGSIEPWLPEANAQNEAVTEAAAAAAGRFATRYDSVYDGVLGPWFLPRFMAATGLDALDYVILLPAVERCVQRVAARRDHGFTDEPATRTMHEQFSRADIAGRHVLVDPPDRPDDVANLIEVSRASQSLTFTLTDRS